MCLFYYDLHKPSTLYNSNLCHVRQETDNILDDEYQISYFMHILHVHTKYREIGILAETLAEISR